VLGFSCRISKEPYSKDCQRPLTCAKRRVEFLKERGQIHIWRQVSSRL
jgi:hypothetical protein